MIDIDALRRDKRPQSAWVVHALIDRLEAAEKELAELRSSMKFRTSLIGRTEAERDALRAKIETMEKQGPVATVRINAINGNPSVDFIPGHSYLHHNDKLYLAPGAQAQPAKNAVAYLDLGTGGYMDVGTDLTDEELAALPKGRHMLGIVGTYGVDGYVPAQPAPSVPDLLEALKDMVNLVELMCPFDGPQQRKARAAIARATGEQQP